ncbi:MAG TPA: MobF family relaxase, partial [Acidimicrobiales bacterium]|nr:MobF family relaxase [Acidimicrobiales bacterium]
MLAIHLVPPGGQAYYLATVQSGRRDGTRLVEPDGIWLGATALAMGLHGAPVTPQALGALLAGIDPATGEVLDPRHHRVRNVAYDCTFSPPKSVSILHALARPDVVAEVRAAHESSVAATLGYLERRATVVRRRSDGERSSVPAGGLGAASFLHRSSRAADPHLHSHVLVANLAADESGRWSALDSRRLFLHAAAASALYGAHLRAELAHRLGVGFEQTTGHGDVLGIGRRVVEAFSRRSQAISAELAEASERGPVSERLASLLTRPEKDLTASYEELQDEWRQRMRSLGISPQRLDEAVGVRRSQPGLVAGGGAHSDRNPPGGGMPELPLGHLARRELVAWCARASAAGARVEAVELLVDDLARHGQVMAAGSAQPRLHRAVRYLPAGVDEERYVTPATALLERRWHEAIAAAPDAAPASLSGWPAGLSVIELPAGALDRAITLARLGEAHARSGGRIVAVVAGGMCRAAGLEGSSGVETVAAAAHLPTLRAATLLVEEQLVEHSPQLAAEVLRRAEGG